MTEKTNESKGEVPRRLVSEEGLGLRRMLLRDKYKGAAADVMAAGGWARIGVLYSDDPIESVMVHVFAGTGAGTYVSTPIIRLESLELRISRSSLVAFTVLSRFLPFGATLFHLLARLEGGWGRERARLVVELERAAREALEAAGATVEVLEPDARGIAALVRRERHVYP